MSQDIMENVLAELMGLFRYRFVEQALHMLWGDVNQSFPYIMYDLI